jgi:hypothetical protein
MPFITFCFHRVRGWYRFPLPFDHIRQQTADFDPLGISRRLLGGSSGRLGATLEGTR